MPSHPSPLHARRPRVARYLVGIAAVPLLIGVLAPLASAQTGNDPGPSGHPRMMVPLTDAQKACMAQHGVTLPTPGQKLPGPPTAAQLDAFRADAQACGLPTPKGPVQMVPLTDAQQACLSQHGVTLPTPGQKLPGPPTAAQRDAFRAAAQACGLPAPTDLQPSSSS